MFPSDERYRSNSGSSTGSDSGILGNSRAATPLNIASITTISEETVTTAIAPAMQKITIFSTILSQLWQQFIVLESIKSVACEKLDEQLQIAKSCMNAKSNPGSITPKDYGLLLSALHADMLNPNLKQTDKKPEDYIIYNYRIMLNLYVDLFTNIENYKNLFFEKAREYLYLAQQQHDSISRHHNAELSNATRLAKNHHGYIARFSAPLTTSVVYPQSVMQQHAYNCQRTGLDKKILERKLMNSQKVRESLTAEALVWLEQSMALKSTMDKIDKFMELNKKLPELHAKQQLLKQQHDQNKTQLEAERKKWFKDKSYIKLLEVKLNHIVTEFNANDFAYTTYKTIRKNLLEELLTKHSRIGGDQGIIYQDDMDPVFYFHQVKTYKERTLTSIEQELLALGVAINLTEEEIAQLSANVRKANNQHQFACEHRNATAQKYQTADANNQAELIKQQHLYSQQQQINVEQQRLYDERLQQLQGKQLIFPSTDPNFICEKIRAENEESINRLKDQINTQAQGLSDAIKQYKELVYPAGHGLKIDFTDSFVTYVNQAHFAPDLLV